VENYLQSFSWNKVKYRADKPIAELIDILQKVRPHLELIVRILDTEGLAGDI